MGSQSPEIVEPKQDKHLFDKVLVRLGLSVYFRHSSKIHTKKGDYDSSEEGIFVRIIIYFSQITIIFSFFLFFFSLVYRKAVDNNIFYYC